MSDRLGASKKMVERGLERKSMVWYGSGRDEIGHGGGSSWWTCRDWWRASVIMINTAQQSSGCVEHRCHRIIGDAMVQQCVGCNWVRIMRYHGRDR